MVSAPPAWVKDWTIKPVQCRAVHKGGFAVCFTEGTEGTLDNYPKPRTYSAHRQKKMGLIGFPLSTPEGLPKEALLGLVQQGTQVYLHYINNHKRPEA